MSERALLLRLSAGPVSGSALASELGITRAAVHKRIEGLRQAGIDIQARLGHGYTLATPVSLLDADVITQALEGSAGHECHALHLVFDTPSTQALALATAAPKSGCDVWLAERQRAGQGRRGRVWASPLAANIYLSVARRFECGYAGLSGLSLAVGVVLAESLRALGFVSVGVKWPNDLLADGKKLGGVLIQLRGEAGGPCEAVIGVGINVRMPASAAPEIDQPWCDLHALATTMTLPSRNHVVATLLQNLLPALARFERDGLAPFAARWPTLDVLLSRSVVVLDGQRRVTGIALGITESGALRLAGENGEQHFHGGEVSLRSA